MECVNGVCEPCDGDPCCGVNCGDGNPCTDDGCSGGICSHTPIPCDDGDPCTDDACVGGNCSHTPMNCDDGNPCTVDTCVDGVCQYIPKNCDDGDPCTDDACVDGECVNTPKDCDDWNPCTEDACDPLTGECVHTEMDCDDGDPCTDDWCLDGECMHPAKDCNDYEPCTGDACDPVTGECVHTWPNCDDGDPCTNDLCDPDTGLCVSTVEPDEDEDGITDDCDNCPDDYNPDQADADEDGVGDVCECEEEGLAEGEGPGVSRVGFWGDGEVPLRKVGEDEWTNDPYDGAGATAVGDPVWRDPDCTGTPAKNEPICFARGSRPRITVKLCNCEARDIVVRAVNTAWGVEWRKPVSAQQSQQTIDLGPPVAGALPNSVQTGVLSLSWSLSEDGGGSWTAIGETAHTIFIPFAAVSGSRAAKRMQWVCDAGAQAADNVDCARKMHVALEPFFNPGTVGDPLRHPWRALDGQKGDCRVLSYLLKSALEHQGLTGAEVMYVMASTDTACETADPGGQQTRTCLTHGQDRLCFWIPAFNAYEACCVYQQVWFAGGLDFDKASGLEVLRQLVGPPGPPSTDKQWWTYGTYPNYHQHGPSVPCP